MIVSYGTKTLRMTCALLNYRINRILGWTIPSKYYLCQLISQTHTLSLACHLLVVGCALASGAYSRSTPPECHFTHRSDLFLQPTPPWRRATWGCRGNCQVCYECCLFVNWFAFPFYFPSVPLVSLSVTINSKIWLVSRVGFIYLNRLNPQCVSCIQPWHNVSVVIYILSVLARWNQIEVDI